jgi:uncharacterized protein YndB with AHSA1/START domain
MANSIEKTVDLKAPVEKVWHALTDHEQFGSWFRVKLEGPFVLGELSRGRVTYPGYEHLRWEARVVRMEKPKVFAFTWHPYAVDPDKDYFGEPPTLVEFTLTPRPAGTHLRIVESGFDALPLERRDEAMRMNEGGWAVQMENVKAHVERG